MGSRSEFAAALLLDLVGAGVALLVSTRHWQTAQVLRPRPLTDQVFGLTGRTLDSAPTALAVVALAGVVAVVAVRGWARRAVGVVLAAVGITLGWRSLTLLGAIDVDRARDLHGARRGVDIALAHSHVSASTVWPWLSAVGGLLIAIAGVLVAWRGSTWASLSARYEAPVPTRQGEEAQRARAQASIWQSLDRGDDPTDAASAPGPDDVHPGHRDAPSAG